MTSDILLLLNVVCDTLSDDCAPCMQLILMQGLWKRQADNISSLHALCAHIFAFFRLSLAFRFKIAESANMKAGAVGVPQQTTSASAEEGKGAVLKAGADREKKMKRTERLRNLERELKRNLLAATAQQGNDVDDAAAAAADHTDGDVECASELPPCRPRVKISGFSNWLINGVYEEAQDDGQCGHRLLQHVDNDSIVLEWLNGECG